MRALTVSLLVSIWLIWLLALLFSESLGLAIDGPSSARFAVSGSLGDSFGPIAALMATLTAVGAYMAFAEQRKLFELDRFERNLFNLLEKLESIVGQTSIEWGSRVSDDEFVKFDYELLSEQVNYKPSSIIRGRRALSVILFVIREEIGEDGFTDIKRVAAGYDRVFDNHVGILAHYFRTVYHIYRLIDETCPVKKDYYCRIVRAGFSNSELRLIGYTCTVGLGRKKFKKFVSDYSILHNIHRGGLDISEKNELDFFRRKLPDSAFRFEPVEPVTYDD